MRYPFNGTHPITCDYNCHLSNPAVAKYAGVDWSMNIGTPLYAIESGTVKTGTGIYGEKVVNLTSADKRRRWEYIHCSKFAKTGTVAEGDLVGYSGNTGITTGAHLHLSLIEDGVRKDPLSLLDSPMRDINANGHAWLEKNRPDVVKWSGGNLEKEYYWWCRYSDKEVPVMWDKLKAKQVEATANLVKCEKEKEAIVTELNATILGLKEEVATGKQNLALCNEKYAKEKERADALAVELKECQNKPPESCEDMTLVQAFRCFLNKLFKWSSESQ